MRLWPKWMAREAKDVKRSSQEAQDTLKKINESWPEIQERVRVLRLRDSRNQYAAALREVLYNDPAG